MSSGGPDDPGGVESGVETDHHDVGLAETMAPVAGSAPPDASTEPSGERPALGDRPVSDRLQRAVSRAKIAGQLFATDERVKLGRYHLLELVGSGGMGVVWGAWDPELERRVAIKLVKATMQAARERILLEGQALARLSHPNVVPVFDVGVVEEQVYLVMEWVRGKNLRAWCKEPRSVREIVAVYRDAGLGLAAAHHAGLIHRDFKPDNAIRGDDGRVRVLDFGLARGDVRRDKPERDDTPTPSSDLTRGAGTPRYMPPEQAQGGTLTPAVDQYAFCVSLREALLGRTADGKPADMPGWLDQIVARGAAHEVKARYPSMDELLRALARDPRTVWRRRAIVTGALGLAGAAFAIGTLRGGSDDAARCVGGKDAIARIWNPQVRTALLAHVGGLGTYGEEESKKLDAELTDYGERWADTHRAACQARNRGELTPQLYERNLGCLARANAALGAVVGVLGKVPVERLPDAIVAARELPRIDRCATEAAASRIEPPSEAIAAKVAEVSTQVERVRMLALALEPDADTAAATAVAEAEATRYLPVIARANLALGLARLQNPDPHLAIEPLATATHAALAAGDDVVAIEAFAREIYAVTTSAPSDLPPGAADVLATVGFAEPIAIRLKLEGAFARTLFYNNVGVSRLASADRAGARTWFEKAISERRGAADQANVELAGVAANLALAVDDREQRTRLFDDTVRELTAVVGPNHPTTLATRLLQGLLTGNPKVAATQIRDVCERFMKYHPHASASVIPCAFELGWLAEERGDPDETRRWMSVLVKLPEAPQSKVAAGYVLMLDGDNRGAAAAMDALAGEVEGSQQLWQRGQMVDLYLVAAACRHRLGDDAGARKALAAAIGILEPGAQAFPILERRLARARGALARLLSTRDPAKSKRLAGLAGDWYRLVGGYDAIVVEMDQLAR